MPRKGTNGPPGNRKTHNLTVDADSHAALLIMQDGLAQQWGFKPSLSQVMKYLIAAALTKENTP